MARLLLTAALSLLQASGTWALASSARARSRSSSLASSGLLQPGHWGVDHEMFMRYMPEHNLVVCGCGKCGSSSMYSYIYQKQFGDDWPHRDRPYPQNVTSDRWKGSWKMIHEPVQQNRLMRDAFSFALIRDPKERLVSAWMSKVTCNDMYKVDKHDRSFMVPKIRELQNATALPCLSLEDFAQALSDIQRLGRTKFLDRHFLPQHLGCFGQFPASKWSAVKEIKSSDSFQQLLLHIRPNASYVEPAHTHASAGEVMITDKAAALLDNVTRDEYRMLRPFLTAHSRVRAGPYVPEP